jgi:hypothetical protein
MPMLRAKPWLDRWLVPASVFVLAFLPRAIYPISRGWLWYLRSIRFWDALLAGDWARTYQRYHPGVTVMWLAGCGLKLFARYRGLTSDQLLGVTPARIGTFDAAVAAGVSALAFGVALCIAWGYVLIKRITDAHTALVGSLFLALDPFLIAFGKQIHLNATLAAFMMMSALFLLNHLRVQKRAHLVWSGVFAGLSLLTKLPALFLFPFAALALAVHRLKDSASLRSAISGLRFDLAKLLLWAGVAAAVFGLLWPAMWVEPLDVLRSLAEWTFVHVETAAENPTFFNGQITADPGLAFYLATIGWKTTLVTLPLAGLALLFLLFRPRQAGRDWIAWLLLAYAAFYTLQMGLAGQKDMSYMLPAFAALDLLAAWGLVQGVQAIDRVGRRRVGPWEHRRPWLPTTLIALALSAQAAVTLARHPYYGTHHNALLGGTRVAQHMLPLQDQGEGLDLAAKYMNTLPHAQYSGAWMLSRSALIFQKKYEGLTTTVPDPRATYRVYYINHVMRRLHEEQWIEAWEADRQTTPLWSVAFDGVPYVWVYGKPPEEPAAGGPQYTVDYRVGDHIRLTAYRLSSERVSPGDTLTVVLFWQSDGQTQEDYTVFCHLLSASSELVAQHDGRPVLEIRPVPSWRAGEVMLDSHPIALNADLSPGEYELSVGMYDLDTLERAPAYNSVGERLLHDRIVLHSLSIR